ncbi:MAG: sulfite exporter TauE/SafE family protein [Gammaproteobacteria bacterium]
MEPWYGLILFFAGCVAGFLNVLAGGGSLLTVPIMVFMGIPGPVANGTNRIGILVQNIVSVFTFFKRGFSDFRLSLTLSAMSIPGAVAGAMLGTELDGVWFNRVLALIMLAVMVIMALEKRYLAIRTEEKISRTRVVMAHLAMIGIGFYGGFIQIGVGFIIMPVLQRILGLDLVRVNMHKVFIVGVFTMVALIVFASRVEILWFLGGCLALGNALGGWFGTHMSVVKGEKLIKIVLNTVLVIFIIKLLFFS